ncbi:GLPGLI family protein [Chryseobacterium binzhouense]|uniref:GLPGLI family protein n=1 Tax=Chryseobacterium binzhouense TaxID=2593646 RepID=UPI00289B285E|nr:GLPGLI family protein [Chryseobacterium binzhouense]
MKLLTALGFFFIVVFCNAQNKRFTYEYRFIPDSANISDVKTEMMNLDVSSEGSKFYSYTVHEGDSVAKAEIAKQLETTGMIKMRADMHKGLIKYSVTKKYPSYDVALHSKIFLDQYKVAETRPMKWKIISENQKIGEWNAQKAEAYFAGRHWIAWFTTEIPIQDGPYKFHGLPGLIVKIEDQTKSHQFTLRAIKSIGSAPIILNFNKEIPVNLKQFEKLTKDYEKDPTKGLKQMQMGGFTMIMESGQNNHMKDQEARLKERFKKNNNRIELNTVQ